MGANFNFNKVILGGRMTADPELKTTTSGVSVTSFTVAVNRRVKNGEAQADFINCTAWRGTAEFICKYFKKASSICLEGSLQVRSWTDKDGNKRYATEVIAEQAYFVDGKNDTQNNGAYIPEAYTSHQEAQMEEIGADDDLPF